MAKKLKQVLGSVLPAPANSFHRRVGEILNMLYTINQKLSLNASMEGESTDTPIISEVISPNDKMFVEMPHYLFVSASAIRVIKFALNMASKKDVRSILDFPCGHGRVLRSLVAHFPSAHITACDLEKDAVDFCKDTFRVEGVYSDTDISKIRLPRKYDLIWCGSLLTHFDEKIAKEFLALFIENLEEDGILVFTTQGRFATKAVEHDAYYAEALNDLKTNDYAFAPAVYEIDGGYAIPNYGGSFIKMPWIGSWVQQQEDIRLIYFSEKFWAGHHDVIAVQKKELLR